MRVGDRVRIAPTSPITGHVGCWHVVTELFELAGVTFAFLTPKETSIPPIVAADELIVERVRGRSRSRRGGGISKGMTCRVEETHDESDC